MNKAVFFDRDGVINREIGNYVCSTDAFEILPDAIDAMKAAIEKGYQVFVITNQGGIAKGLYTHEILSDIHNILLNACEKAGISITEIFYCPHHPVSSNCICRKPDSLMLEKAIAKYNIDPGASWMIGDTERDSGAAAKAGVRAYMVQSNESKKAFIDIL